MSNKFDLAKYQAMVFQDIFSLWTPHAGQAQVGNALFYNNVKRLFVRCGRKFGKTELELAILYLWAASTFDCQYYYVAPYYNQASELIWHNGRLPNFLGKLTDKYVDHVYDTDKRVKMKSGSFIKLLGSDNHQAGRGINPHGVLYDEVKDHDPRFHEGMKDNLMTHNAALVAVGTPPPEDEHFYWNLEQEFGLRKDGKVFIMPTHMNPHISKDYLAEEERIARVRGDYPAYQREILAMKVRGGAGAIFPMLELPAWEPTEKKFVGSTKHFRPYAQVVEEIKRSIRDWKFTLLFDPGSVSCFAAILYAQNKYTREVIALDEVYETQIGEMTSRKLFPRGMKLYTDIHWDVQKLSIVYDNAARWFRDEVLDHFSVAMTPCAKDINQKDDKLNFLKDMLLIDMYSMTDRCHKHAWEMGNYYVDDKGNIPKKNDHTIDLARYYFNFENYTTLPKRKNVIDPESRTWRPEHEDEYHPGDRAAVEFYPELDDEGDEEYV